MGIAYTQQKQVYAQFRADTSAHFRADLDAIITSTMGPGKTLVTNGFIYSFHSPAPFLFAKLLVQDKGATVGPFNTPAITLQMMSEDESVKGLEHHLIYGPPAYTSRGYQIIIGYCQMFISLPGVDNGGVEFTGIYAHSFACGIPRVPDGSLADCTAETSGAISMLWWSCGSGDEAFTAIFNLRNNLWCRSYFSECVNGVVGSGSGFEGPQSGSLQLYTMQPTYNIDLGQALPLTVQYITNVPLDIDTFIGWQFKIQGQLWDSFLRTAAEPLDGIIITNEVDSEGTPYNATWRAYNSTVYGTLYLRTDDFVPTSDAGWNYAY